MPSKRKSKRQIRLLLSKGSPLTADQKSRLRGELRSGTVKQTTRKKKRKKR